MDDGAGSRLVRSDFATSDTIVAEDFLRRGYSDSKLTITGMAEDFTFVHVAVAGPGFSVNRLQVGVAFTNDAVPEPGDPLTVIQSLGGRFAYADGIYPEVQVGAGDVVLVPPVGPLLGICDRFDLAAVQLDRCAVAGYASAVTGLDADALTFDEITPRTPDLGLHWTDAVLRVRDDVLTDPWAAANPILLAQAFRSLTAALLSTFPNSALARATDPDAPPVRGDVSAARLRDVADYLDSHADRPIGPADVADLAGMPVVEVVEGFRRRYRRHPAELLWQARLRGVRRDLLDADPGSASVAALAARWGFARPGRFRTAYLRRFDETPEQTLDRRCRP